MKEGAITYATMNADLIRELPELKSEYDRQLAHWGEELGPHLVYQHVLYVAIKNALDQKPENKVFLKRAFTLLERLLAHSDVHVQEVAHQSICDSICADEVVLQKVQRYLGKRAKETCSVITE